SSAADERVGWTCLVARPPRGRREISDVEHRIHLAVRKVRLDSPGASACGALGAGERHGASRLPDIEKSYVGPCATLLDAARLLPRAMGRGVVRASTFFALVPFAASSF